MKAIFSSFITVALSLPTRHLHLFFCACAKAVQTSTRSFQISFFPSVTLSLSPPPCCVLHLATPGGRYISSERWSVTTAHQDVKHQGEGRIGGGREGGRDGFKSDSQSAIKAFTVLMAAAAAFDVKCRSGWMSACLRRDITSLISLYSLRHFLNHGKVAWSYWSPSVAQEARFRRRSIMSRIYIPKRVLIET